MGVQSIVREYSNPFRAETTDWPLGNVGTWQKLLIDFSVSVDKEFALTNPLQFERPNKFTLSDGTTWEDYGFEVGDSVTLSITETDYSGMSPSDTTNTYVMTIDALDGDEMTTDAVLGDIDLQLSFIPGRFNDIEYSNVFIYATKQPEGIDLVYNHLTNDNYQSNSLNSFLDGTKTRFKAIDVDTMSVSGTQTMLAQGTQSGLSIKDVVLTYDGASGRFYNYSIEFEFMFNPVFDDENNFINSVAPSAYFDANCITDQFQIIAYPTLNNPNFMMSNDLNLTRLLGNTGWFNENFNGGQNGLTLDSISYETTTGTTVNQLDYANDIKVTAEISGVANLSTMTVCSFGFMWVPVEEDDYKNKNTPFYKNTKICTGGGGFTDAFNVSTVFDTTSRQGFSVDNSRMDVTDIRFSDSSGTLVFEATFQPTSEFLTEFASKQGDRNYILWISVADYTKDTNSSDRVSLLLDYNSLETYIEPVGAYEPMSIELLDHPILDSSTGGYACGTDIRIEDDLLAKVQFSIDKTEDFNPTGLTYAIITENSTTGQQYVLESYPIDLTAYPRVADIPQYNFVSTRGFRLPVGNNKNDVQVIRDATNDSGNNVAYLGLYGFKIRWEDWISRTNVPADFFNISELNNGQNNDWYQYLSVADWNMFFVVWLDADIIANSQTVNVRYENKIDLVFSDYDSNADIDTEIRYYRESTGTLLNGGTDPITGNPLGVILEGELVEVEIDFERLSGTWSGTSTSYAVTTIEVDQGAGFKALWQISTEYDPRIDNPLRPLAGETRLKMDLVSSTIIKTSCLIDSSLLDDAIRYKITGRLGCKS